MMAALTAEERAILTARLAEAEAAYHKLMTGGAAKVFVDQNGERIEYQTSTRSNLNAYIAELKRQLGLGCPTGPMQPWF